MLARNSAAEVKILLKPSFRILYRIEILLLVAERDGITIKGIVETLGANEKTIGEHTRRLYQAGLINKKYRGKFVEHTLSPYGKTFVSFLTSFQHT